MSDLPPLKQSYHPTSLHTLYLHLAASLLSFVSNLGQSIEVRRNQARVKKEGEVEVKELMVESREKGRGIRVMSYEKRGSGGEVRRPRAVHLNWHGSGFLIPSLGTDTDFCASLASALPSTIILDCDYRKAPSTPFPGYHFDSIDIITYIKSRPDLYDANKISLSGFSAGGTIAMTLATSLPKGDIKGLINFYGNPDLAQVNKAPSITYEGGLVLPDALRVFFYSCAFLPSQDRKDPRVSAAYAAVESWPKYVMMSCGEADSLYVGGEEMVERLKKEEGGEGKTEVSFVGVEGAAHSWDKLTKKSEKLLKAKVEVYGKAAVLIKRAQEDALSN